MIDYWSWQKCLLDTNHGIHSLHNYRAYTPYSPHIMNNQWVTKNGRTAKRGLFVDGMWYCDCETRLPAEKFQVKNGGKNHGKWFFTCQNGQPKRCGFFLWATDAKIREEAAVLGNSRTEPGAEATTKVGDGGRLRSAPTNAPQTPKKQMKITQPVTPASKTKTPASASRVPVQPKDATWSIPSPQQMRTPLSKEKTPARASAIPNSTSSRGMFAEESFEWSSSDEAQLADLADHVDPATTDDESPRKAAKRAEDSSPRKAAQTAQENPAPPASQLSNSTETSAFATPSTSRFSGDASGLLSPAETPAGVRRVLFPEGEAKTDEPQGKEGESEKPMSLALEVMSLLSPVKSAMPAETQQRLVALLNNHEFRARGTEKGRDLARAAIKAREGTITELRMRISSLEGDKARQKLVIDQLKVDLLKSPKKRQLPTSWNIEKAQDG